MELTRSPTQHARNFREVDWKSFRKTLEKKLDKIESPSCINSPLTLNRVCDKLTRAIQENIEYEVPTTEICIKSKRWWSKELTLLRREVSKLSRKTYKHRNWPGHPSHAEHKEALKKYNKDILYAKQHHWRDWLEKATDPDIWTAHRYISAPASDGGKTRIPSLTIQEANRERTASKNEDKCEALVRAFFPNKPQQP